MIVIFSRLAIGASDRALVEGIRRRFDPQQPIVEAHFTFVFPFRGVAADEVLDRARRIAADTAPIPFRLSDVAVVRDPLGPATHLFLIPAEGADRMLALHARLYSGVLAAHRHPTAKFAPHVTVGAFETQEDAARAAGALPALDITGVLESLIVAEFDGQTVVDLGELRFAS